MVHKQRTAAACSLCCRSLCSQFRTANVQDRSIAMFKERRSAVLKLTASLFWDFQFPDPIIMLIWLLPVIGSLRSCKQTNWSKPLWKPKPDLHAAMYSLWNCNLNSYSQGINRTLGTTARALWAVSCQSALIASHRWPAWLKWAEAAEVSFHSAPNVSWRQLWACGVNPPWQDCWDGSASTATLAGSVCLAIHTATKRSAGLVQSGRRKGDSPGQVFLCSLSLWLLRSFFVFLRDEADRGREEW